MAPPPSEENATDNALRISLTKPTPQLLQPPMVRADITRQPHIKLPDTKTVGCLKFQPSVLRFEPQEDSCKPQEQVLRILHTNAPECAPSLTLSEISLTQQGGSPFHLRAAPKLLMTLQKNQFIEIRIGYRPEEPGTHSDVLTIEHSDDTHAPLHIPIIGQAAQQEFYTESFQRPPSPKADILFVIDNSTSMAEEQQQLTANFEAFIAWAVRLNIDYQIMVTTTNTGGRETLPGCAHKGPGSNTPMITRGTPAPEAIFLTNTRVGISEASQGKGLETAYKALTLPALASCNHGFLRKDAELHVIFISDRPDTSPEEASFYTNFFKNLKGSKNLDQIRVSAIVGPPGNCNNPITGNASHGPRYIAVADELNGIVESICNANWANTLSTIGSVLLGYHRHFFLSRRADPATLSVKVNGQTVKQGENGWTYDPATNSILFSLGAFPPPGSHITVQYKTLCLP